MRVLIYELAAPGQLVTKEKILSSEFFADDSILAETIYSVISPGTELAAWQGLTPLRPSTGYPRLIGYCNLAKVVKVGNLVANIKTGDYVLTHQSHRSGFVCKEKDILKRFDELEDLMLKKISASYLYHLGYSALIRGGYRPGYQVAIVGMGALGILTAELVKLYGLEPLIFTNQSDTNFFTSVCGFSHIFEKNSSAIKNVQEICMMDGVDIVINTSNEWDDHLLSMQLVRAGGEVICIGFPGRGQEPPQQNPLDSQYFYDKQLSIRQCGYVSKEDLSPMDSRFTLRKNMHYFSTLILQNKLNPACILSIETGWDSLESTYNILSMHKKSLYSALINWRL